MNMNMNIAAMNTTTFTPTRMSLSRPHAGRSLVCLASKGKSKPSGSRPLPTSGPATRRQAPLLSILKLNRVRPAPMPLLGNVNTRVMMDSQEDQDTTAGTQGSVPQQSINRLKLNIQGRHLKVTESMRSYVEDQVEKCVSHFMNHHHDVNKGKNSPISSIDVRLSTRGGPRNQTKGPQRQKAEVTIRTTIGVVRAEVETDQAYNAIDEAAKTCERKLRKLKEKAIAKGVWNGHGVRKKDRKGNKLASYDEYVPEEQEEELEVELEWDSFVEDVGIQSMSQKEEDLNIYRKKQVDLIPMSIADAVESLQFLGHDFFMFLDKDANEIKVVYRRDVAGYGVLTPVYPPNHSK
mmetsp:Transcript_2493/g.7625  ORF Transcript_2493/g.7625 Transcript_2493/m.7625 type:complete len:349 (-) Transcript_2493:268-1314(-)